MTPGGIATAESAGLIYQLDTVPGITRRRHGKGFTYRAPDGSHVTDPETLDRINRLAIPPAYREVWISPLANGHLQATGRDARGRKQYRYHPDFIEHRDEHKFGRMLEFSKSLPAIREAVDKHLRMHGVPREKALATVVALLERTLIRIGNTEYARENKHYGLTTLRNRHAQIDGSLIRLAFPAKSGVNVEVELRDRRLAKVLRQIQELPGQELFGYLDDRGEYRDVSSVDVNAYLREISGGDFTAKDFRTWAGSLLMLMMLDAQEPCDSQTGRKRIVAKVVKSVARSLGNTPAVCRKGYIHPLIVEKFMAGELPPCGEDAERDLAALLAA